MIKEHTHTVFNKPSQPTQMATCIPPMTAFRQTTRLLSLFVLILLLCTLGNSPAMATYTITQWTISSGGTTEATGGNWQLAGTIGQWEATPARALSGGPWRLTGGFWAADIQALTDLIFKDQFKQQSNAPGPANSTEKE